MAAEKQDEHAVKTPAAGSRRIASQVASLPCEERFS